MLAINLQESRDKVAAWAKAKNVSFTILLDPTGATSQGYDVTVTPTVFVVSREGTLIGKALGTKSWTSAPGLALLDRLAGP